MIQNKKIKRFSGYITVAFCLSVFAIAFFIYHFPSKVFAATGINGQIAYQGRLADSNGVAVADGTYNAKFVIYDASTGGNCLWTAIGDCTTSDHGTTTVSVTNGIFTIYFGDTGQNSLATSSIDFNTDSLYLGVTIRGTSASPQYDDEMTPRKRLGASPYAFNSDFVDGLHATTTATASQILALDANKVFKIADGGVSTTRATTSDYLSIDGGLGENVNVTNLNYSGGDLYVADALEVDGTAYFQRTTSTQATTTDYLWVGVWAAPPTGMDLQGGDVYISDALFAGGNATTTGSLTAGSTLYVQSDNNKIGVATTSPWGYFSVEGQGTGPSLVVSDSSNNVDFLVQDTGHIAIGTATLQDTYGLTVATTTRFANNALFAASATSTDFDTSGLRIRGITGANDCLQVDTNGYVSGTGAGCSGFQSWQWIFANAISPTSTSNGIYVTASSTIAANFRVDGTATTTGNMTVLGNSAFGVAQPFSTTTVRVQDIYTYGDINGAGIQIDAPTTSAIHTGLGDDSIYYGIRVINNPAVASTTYGLYVENGGNIYQQAGQIKHLGSITDDSTTVLTGATAISVHGKYAYVTAGTDNALEILDISSSTGTPVHIGSISDGASTILSNPFGIDVQGRYAYIASTGEDGLEVVDISNPASPIHAGSITDNTDTELDGTAGTQMQIKVQGRYAYVVAHTDDGLSIVDIADPTNPRHVGAITDDATTLLNGAQGLDIQGRYAYVTSVTDNGVSIIDVSDPKKPIHAGAVSGGATASRGIVVEGKHAYVTSGATTDGLHIYDVSDPTNPLAIGSLLDSTSADYALSGTRSVVVAGRYAYVASESEDAVVVVDVSDPVSPQFVRQIKDTDHVSAELNGVYDLFLQGNRIYATGFSDDGVEVLEITGIEAPSASIGSLVASDFYVRQSASIGRHLSVGSGLNVGPQGILSQGGIASQGSIEISGQASTTGNPFLRAVGRISDGNPAGTELDGPKFIAIQGRYAYVTAQIDDGVEVLDISSPTGTPVHAGAILNGGGVALDGPEGIDIQGRYLYVAANVSDAVEIIDVSKPSSPTHVGSIASTTDVYLNGPTHIRVQGKYAYVNANSSDATLDGMQILDISDPSNPIGAGSIQDSGAGNLFTGAYGLDVQGRYAYVTGTTDDSLLVIDISDPQNPTLSGSITDSGSAELDNAWIVKVQGSYAYVGGSADDGISIVNISDPTNPTHVGAFTDTAESALNYPVGIALAGNYLFAGSLLAPHGIEVLDISDKANPRHVTALYDDATLELNAVEGVAIQGRFLYAAGNTDDGIEVMEIVGLQTPTAEIGSLAAGTLHVWQDANIANQLSVGSGLNVGPRGIHSQGSITSQGSIEISGQASTTGTQFIRHFGSITDDNGTATELGGAQDIKVRGKYAYVAANTDDGVEILDISSPTGTPVHVGSITDDGSTALDGVGFIDVQGKYLYYSSLTDRGLGILDISDPTNPSHVSAILDSAGDYYFTNPEDVVVRGRYLYTVTGLGLSLEDGITILDISDPASFVQVGFLEDDGTTLLERASRLDIQGRYAYVTSDFDDAIQIVDISDPTTPIHVGNVADSGDMELNGAHGIVVEGRYAYIAGIDDDGFSIVDVSDPSSPTHVGAITDDATTGLDGAEAVAIQGNYAFVTATIDNAVEVIDISDRVNPRHVSVIYDDATTELDDPWAIDISGRYAYVASQDDSGVEVLEIVGLDSPSANIGSLEASNVDVTQGLNISGFINVFGSGNIGSDFLVSGDFTAGSTTGGLLHVNAMNQTVFIATTSHAVLYDSGTDYDRYALIVGGNTHIQGGATTTGRLVVGSPATYHADFAAGDIAVSGKFYNNSTENTDYAETVQTSELVEPGDVISIDLNNANKFKLSEEGHDQFAAGIISTNPAFLISAFKDSKSEFSAPLALAGRVATKVVSENGSIEIGDALTTSNTKGHAMKACGDTSCENIGIIGLALEPFFQNGTTTSGVIEVLVRDSGNVVSSVSGNGQRATEDEEVAGQLGVLQNADGSHVTRLSVDELEVKVLVAQEIETQTLVVRESAVFVGDIIVKSDATFESVVVFKDHVYFDQDSSGSVTVFSGNRSQRILFAKPYIYTPRIIATPQQLIETKFAITSKTAEGFSVTLLEPQLRDVRFDWVAIASPVSDSEVLGDSFEDRKEDSDLEEDVNTQEQNEEEDTEVQDTQEEEIIDEEEQLDEAEGDEEENTNNQEPINEAEQESEQEEVDISEDDDLAVENEESEDENNEETEARVEALEEEGVLVEEIVTEEAEAEVVVDEEPLEEVESEETIQEEPSLQEEQSEVIVTEDENISEEVVEVEIVEEG